MHSRLYVTINKTDEVATSEQARERVQSELENDDSFCGEGGRFGSPLADWFVIGGRWSGDLQFAYVNAKVFEEKVAEITGENGVLGFSVKALKDYSNEIQAAWESLGGNGLHPWARDSYGELGLEDDAKIVTPAIWEYIKKEVGDDEHFVDLDYDEPSEDFINKKWVVVVDYHS